VYVGVFVCAENLVRIGFNVLLLADCVTCVTSDKPQKIRDLGRVTLVTQPTTMIQLACNGHPLRRT
jgi:hypothetical protein